MPVSYQIPPADSHFISVQTAAVMNTRFRSKRELILDPDYREKDILPLSETFNRDALDALLARTNCAAIRIYYGMDENDQVHAVLVGVTAENEDILPGALTLTEEEDEDDYIAEIGQRCPVVCPPESDLNT